MRQRAGKVSAVVELDGIAGGVVAAGVAPSAAVGVARRTAGGGWETRAGGATNAFWDLASLTKPMTAIAVARSGMDRKARIGALLHEVEGTPAADATVELLLAHRAGLEAHVMLPLEGALRAAASARRPDDKGALYSDLGYVLVGAALARHAGTVDAGEAIERLVPIPELGTVRSLRARHPDFDARVQPTEGDLRGIVHDENARLLTGEGGSGHAGMFGTIGAVLAFACEAADFVETDGGRWLVAPWDDGATNLAGFDGKSPTGSSAGERKGPRTFGHLGFTGTSFWIDPDASIVTALLTNRVHPTRANLAIRAARPRVHDALFDVALRMSDPTSR